MLPKIRLCDHCCQAPDKLIDPAHFTIDDLVIARQGSNVLRFSPLGNRPTRPILALVGITPGKQSEKFAKKLRHYPVEVAASKAAFCGSQPQIKKLIAAHGFARHLGIDLDGDLNENPAILTTSLVKCCLMVKGSYKYKAPNIEEIPEARFCASKRFLDDIAAYPTLKWVVIFGEPGWSAIHLVTVAGRAIYEHLCSRN